MLSLDVIRKHRVVPLAAHNGTLEVGVAQPASAALVRELAFLTGKTIVPVTLAEDAFATAWAEQLGEAEAAEKAAAPPPSPAKALHLEGSVVQQVDRLIQAAMDQRASDIHLEPYEHRYRLRYRLDGVLHEVADLALHQREALTARLKIMAGLDIAEKRRPQDGRIRFHHGTHEIDLRASFLPTHFGEKVVLRLLDKSGVQFDLTALGFAEATFQTFRQRIHLPYGMILVTGPTGSGKTTTLYAALNELNTPAVNITTVEDPIEYDLAGINQTQVHPEIGLTFAHALRAFLRQDPNIIMVGEIRDAETAEIAIRAALTGHLVLSTLHTNDAPSAVTRLIDMGIEPFLVAASLRMIVSQRLIRRICPACHQSVAVTPALQDEFALPSDVPTLYEGAGCSACHGTGYRGRTALFEVMPVSEALADLTAQRSSVAALRQQAQREGLQTLRQAAVAHLQAGTTTAAEVRRETPT